MPWFRDTYAEAVWECASLRPIEKIVALTYAQHAGAPKPKPDSDVSWVVWRRLSQLTGIRSKTTLSKVTRALEAAGWMVLVEGKKQHKSPRYQLVIPENPEVRETYVWDGDQEPPEVHELDIKPVDIPPAEVQELDNSEVREMDNSAPPVVHELAPEVQEMTARGSGTGPDSSKDTSTTHPGTQDTNHRTPAKPTCKHKWTADGDCLHCERFEPCPECRRLARYNDTIRCHQHQDHQEAS